MLKNLWLGLLRRAMAALLGVHWAEVKNSVQALMDSELPNEEKRRLALLQLRIMGADVANWLLSAAIEVAYGELKDRARG